MFKSMLQMMVKQAETALAAGESAGWQWIREWGDLFLRAYEPGRKVVYTASYTFPMELLAAFDVAPFDFEIAGSMLASTAAGVPAMKEAEARGYAMDVCSFHRAALGASFSEYFPAPDLLITTSHYCDQKAKTNEVLALLHGKPAFLLYVPAEISRASVAYVEAQLREAAGRLGEITGEKLDEDRLKQAVRSSNRARASHLELLEALKHCPAPWGGGQLIGFSINGPMFQGTEVRERLNQAFLNKVRERIKAGRPRPERHRLYWFAWLPTYASNLFDTLEENHVTVPLCETFRVFWDEIDEDRPFEGLALKCLKNPFVGPLARRIDGLGRIVEEYRIDGALLFATPACRHANAACRLLKDSLARLGIPLLVLDMDISDPRGYSAEQVRTRLEGFIEVLDQSAGPAAKRRSGSA